MARISFTFSSPSSSGQLAAGPAMPLARRPGWRLAALLLAGLLWSAATVQAARLELDDGQVWRYAQALEGQGEYYRAVGEYKRLIFYFPASPYAARARLAMARAYLIGGEPALALEQIERMEQEPGWSQIASPARYLEAVAWLELEQNQPFPKRKDHISRAMGALAQVGGDWPEQPRAQAFAEGWRNAPPPAEKSPWLGAGLSTLLPGAGSLYNQRPLEGGMTFFFTGLFGWAYITSAQAGQPAPAALFGLLALAFYGGGIYEGANGAYKYNDQIWREQLDNLRQSYGITILLVQP